MKIVPINSFFKLKQGMVDFGFGDATDATEASRDYMTGGET